MKMVAAELVKLAKSLMALSRGDMLENGNIRMHRWNSSVQVWDLTNAGRIGKRVDTITIYNLDWAEKAASSEVETFIDHLSGIKSYSQAKSRILDAVKEINAVSPHKVEIDERQERGIDVAPAGFKKIEIHGKHVYVEADYKTFTVKDRDDMNNEPTCIPSGGKKDIKVFYMWVRDNQSWIQNATFHEISEGMSKAGISSHYYCAVD